MTYQCRDMIRATHISYLIAFVAMILGEDIVIEIGDQQAPPSSDDASHVDKTSVVLGMVEAVPLNNNDGHLALNNVDLRSTPVNDQTFFINPASVNTFTLEDAIVAELPSPPVTHWGNEVYRTVPPHTFDFEAVPNHKEYNPESHSVPSTTLQAVEDWEFTHYDGNTGDHVFLRDTRKVDPEVVKFIQTLFSEDSVSSRAFHDTLSDTNDVPHKDTSADNEARLSSNSLLNFLKSKIPQIFSAGSIYVKSTTTDKKMETPEQQLKGNKTNATEDYINNLIRKLKEIANVKVDLNPNSTRLLKEKSNKNSLDKPFAVTNKPPLPFTKGDLTSPAWNEIFVSSSPWDIVSSSPLKVKPGELSNKRKRHVSKRSVDEQPLLSQPIQIHIVEDGQSPGQQSNHLSTITVSRPGIYKVFEKTYKIPSTRKQINKLTRKSSGNIFGLKNRNSFKENFVPSLVESWNNSPEDVAMNESLTGDIIASAVMQVVKNDARKKNAVNDTVNPSLEQVEPLRGVEEKTGGDNTDGHLNPITATVNDFKLPKISKPEALDQIRTVSIGDVSSNFGQTLPSIFPQISLNKNNSFESRQFIASGIRVTKPISERITVFSGAGVKSDIVSTKDKEIQKTSTPHHKMELITPIDNTYPDKKKGFGQLDKYFENTIFDKNENNSNRNIAVKPHKHEWKTLVSNMPGDMESYTNDPRKREKVRDSVRNIFHGPPSPSELFFPSITNIFDNFAHDVDWQGFGFKSSSKESKGSRLKRSPLKPTTRKAQAFDLVIPVYFELPNIDGGNTRPVLQIGNPKFENKLSDGNNDKSQTKVSVSTTGEIETRSGRKLTADIIGSPSNVPAPSVSSLLGSKINMPLESKPQFTTKLVSGAEPSANSVIEIEFEVPPGKEGSVNDHLKAEIVGIDEDSNDLILLTGVHDNPIKLNLKDLGIDLSPDDQLEIVNSQPGNVPTKKKIER